MIHLTTSFTPSHGFIRIEGYQAVTNGNVTFIGTQMLPPSKITVADIESIIRLYQDGKIEIKGEKGK